MSAELEFMIFIEGVKDFFTERHKRMNRKNSELKKLNSEIRKNIEAVKKDTESLKNISSAFEKQKEDIRVQINQYLEYFNEIGEEKKEYVGLLKKLEESSNLSEVLDISSEAAEIMENYKYEEETKKISDEDLIKQYIVLKMKEMGQEIYINEAGIIVAVSNDKNIVAEVGKDSVKVDILGKSTECVKNIRNFEKIIKNEMKKTSSSWHSPQREKELKQIINKICKEKETEKTNRKKIYSDIFEENIYDEKLMNKIKK